MTSSNLVGSLVFALKVTTITFIGHWSFLCLTFIDGLFFFWQFVTAKVMPKLKVEVISCNFSIKRPKKVCVLLHIKQYTKNKIRVKHSNDFILLFVTLQFFFTLFFILTYWASIL